VFGVDYYENSRASATVLFRNAKDASTACYHATASLRQSLRAAENRRILLKWHRPMRKAIQLMQRMNTLIVNGFDEVPTLEQLVEAFIECGEVHDIQVFPRVYFPSFGVD
jgi:hypothetical protein